MKRRWLTTAVLAALLLAVVPAFAQVAQTPLNNNNIPQYQTPLPQLGGTGIPFTLGTTIGGTQFVNLSLCEFKTQILPTGTFVAGQVPLTSVWGYIEGPCPLPTANVGHSYLGPVVLAKRGVPTQMTYINRLPDAQNSQVKAWNRSTDTTVIWGDPRSLNASYPTAGPVIFNNPVGAANPELNDCYARVQAAPPGTIPPAPCGNNYGGLLLGAPVANNNYAAPAPAAVHLHGGEVPAMLDGGPDAWWTPNGIYGHGYYTRHVDSLPFWGAALPTMPVTVAGLPALPNIAYPVGTVVFDSVTAAYYINSLVAAVETWTAAVVTHPLGAFFYNTTNGIVYENLANVFTATNISAFPVDTLVFNKADSKNYKMTTTGWQQVTAVDRASYVYPNGQEASPIWFHDHILGATRLNVYAGIAGGFMVTDNQLTNTGGLATGLLPLGLDRNGNNTLDLGTDEVLIPLIIQDRMFDTTGELFFPAAGLNPEHPYWVPEFVGDTIVVNGKAWPYFNVQPKRYRFIFLNGSNARSYELFLQPLQGKTAPSIWVIGNDQGYLDTPQQINPAAAVNNKLVIMPGERYEVVIDFGLFPNTQFELRNTARSPYPGGAPVSSRTTGKVMLFQVGAAPATADSSWNPAPTVAVPNPRVRTTNMNRLVNVNLAAVPPTSTPNVVPSKKRQLTLNEVLSNKGPLEILVNNTKYDGTSTRTFNDFTSKTTMWNTTWYSELPYEGETEQWDIINLTADAHPMHPHLVAFQVLERQTLDVKAYTAAYNAAFPGAVYIPGFGPPKHYYCGGPIPGRGPTPCVLGGNPDPAAALALVGAPIAPAPQEIGWKDTVMVPPGMVTRMLVRFAKTTDAVGNNADSIGYDFNPDGGHGFVWHCHIIDHEDNEMMRPYTVLPNPTAPVRNFVMGRQY